MSRSVIRTWKSWTSVVFEYVLAVLFKPSVLMACLPCLINAQVLDYLQARHASACCPRALSDSAVHVFVFRKICRNINLPKHIWLSFFFLINMAGIIWFLVERHLHVSFVNLCNIDKYCLCAARNTLHRHALEVPLPRAVFLCNQHMLVSNQSQHPCRIIFSTPLDASISLYLKFVHHLALPPPALSSHHTFPLPPQ